MLNRVILSLSKGDTVPYFDKLMAAPINYARPETYSQKNSE